MNCLRLLKALHRPIPTTNIFKLSCAKYGQHPVKFMESQDGWRMKDKVSKRWELIYKAPMERWLNCLSVYLTFSTGTIAVGGLYYATFVFDKGEMNNPVLLGDDVVIANSAVECLVYLGAFVMFHVAVKLLLKKYVVRLYQDGDNYLAIFRGHMYNSIEKHKFQLKDVKKLSPTFVVSWGDARYSLDKKHAIILENYFKTPEYFNYLVTKKKSNNTSNEN